VPQVKAKRILMGVLPQETLPDPEGSDHSAEADDEGDGGDDGRDFAALAARFGFGGAGSAGSGFPQNPGGFLFDDAPPDWAGSLDLDELCQELLGLPIIDAEEEVRAALKKASGEATDADTLAVLLRVFRSARDSALEGYDTWDSPVEYCGRLAQLCDRNFLGASAGDAGRIQDFPSSIVAAVYAECGRTLALASKTNEAGDKLRKSLNVFSMMSDPDEADQRQMAAAHASLARVLRRQGQAAKAQDEYLQALQVLAELTLGPELPGLISEYCEVLVEVGEDAALSPALVELVAFLAE
ncbi:unnamed protein product, partial [Polarella glacialis]